MLYKSHSIDLKVNGESLDLSSDFNVIVENRIFTPSDLSSTQAEYSYEATIPATSRNNKIFDFANCLDKKNRFHQRWKAELYADEHLVFDGSLIISSFKDNEYTINLVSPKVYDLDAIFGDAVLTDIPWSATPFNGIATINQYNEEGNGDVMFPLVSYGAFIKKPYYSDDVANDYTSKFVIDKYNKWWVESFYPSLNMLQSIKKAFEWKGYTVGGDVFADSNLKDIYMSCNLASDQVPTYNLGNPIFGEVEITTSTLIDGDGYEQELEFPYFHVTNPRANFGSAESVYTDTRTYEAWNWSSVFLYDLLASGSTVTNQSYMFDPNDKVIVAPSDGWYRIDLDVDCKISAATSSMTVAQNVITDGGSGDDIEEKEVTIPIGMDEMTPVEIAVVRNYDDNYELIKGKWNKQYKIGDPTLTAYTINNILYNNVTEWRTCFPHEDPYNASLPTKTHDLSLRNTQSMFGGNRNSTNSSNTTRSGSRNGGSVGDFGSGRSTATSTPRNYNSSFFGYVPIDNGLMAYDAVVNKDFICGFSSFGLGQTSVIKNGHSWTKSYSDKNEAFYRLNGYNQLFRRPSGSSIEESATTFNHNEYIASPNNTITMQRGYIGGQSVVTAMTGHVSCCVWLNKNDRLEVFEVHRAYHNIYGHGVEYKTRTNMRVKIKAMSPNNMAYLLNEGFAYTSDTEFDVGLRLSNFMNKETTVSSYIQSLLDAFNFQMTQEGKSIFINKRKNPLIATYPPTLDLDSRVSSLDVESESIDFPSSIAVKYRIDTDEWGFENSVPKEKMNDDNWKDYGDSGYTVVQISDDEYNVNNQEKSLNFSYTWYDSFTWNEVDSADTENSGNTIELEMPTISNFQWMVDGYDYDKAMKHDGYSLSQRFWMKPIKSDAFVWTDSYPTEKVNIYLPRNYNDSIVLNYKNQDNSLLRKYFNCLMNLSSNKVKLEVYLTLDEYKMIKDGCRIKFDKAIYIPTDIQYNPNGESPSTLTLMKL